MKPLLLLLLLCLSIVGCSMPSQEELREDFGRKHPAMKQLVDMFSADKTLLSVSLDSVTGYAVDGRWVNGEEAIRAKVITQDRLIAYRRLLDEASIEIAFTTTEGMVKFYVKSRGLAISGSAVGYCYTQNPPTNIVSRLENHYSNGFAYSPLEDGWYMMKGNL